MSENDIVIELLRLINTDLFIYLQSRGDTPARACAGYAPERTAQWKFGKVLAQSVKFPQTCSISFDAEKFRKEALEWTGCGIPPRGIFVENLCSFKHNILLFCHWFNLTLYRSNIINVYLTSYIVVVRFYTPPPPPFGPSPPSERKLTRGCILKDLSTLRQFPFSFLDVIWTR